MKRISTCIAIIIAAACCLASCVKGDTSIVGTFVCSNGLSGAARIRKCVEFKPSGYVYFESQIGLTPKFTTEGNNLYYFLRGQELTIYYGIMGWRSDVRNTPFASGTYHGDYLTLDGERYDRE